MTNKQYIEYIDLCSKRYYENKNLRWGQILFNTLKESYPELAKQIEGTTADPFYTADYNFYLSPNGKAFFMFISQNITDYK